MKKYIDYNDIIKENARMFGLINSYSRLVAAHSTNVCFLTDQFSKGYTGPENHYLVTTAALLHDIGKMIVPSKDETIIMQQHAARGAKMLKLCQYGDIIRNAVLQHHNRADEKSSQNDFAKIISVINEYDSIVNPRNCRNRLVPTKALLKLQQDADDGQLDKYVTKEFIKFMHKEIII